MAIVNIPKKLFEKEIGKLDENMQEKIAMFGTPVESLTADELQIEVFPNRPDLLSYHGFKRSFLGFLGKNKGLKTYKVNNPEKDYSVTIDSTVKDVRPYTACAIVRGLDLDEDRIKELIEIQEKLHVTIGRRRKKLAIGIYPLDKIKLPITFKALEPDQIKFIPLESEKELSGLEILQKHPTGKEYSHLLAGKAKFPIFMDANREILSMPPIINSKSTGHVIPETKDLFIECSGFDFEILKICLNILVTVMADMGGKIYKMEISQGKYGKKVITPDLTERKTKISVDNTNNLFGLELNERGVKNLLEKMGYSYKNGQVMIPAWRTDILHEVDLIEDVAIAYGYDNFDPEIPEIATIGHEDRKEIIKKKISDILIGLEMIEVSNYHLTHKEDQSEKMNSNEKSPVLVKESKTDYNILRRNLGHLLLKNLSENIDAEYPQKIFEIGTVFSLEQEKLIEKNSLAIAVTPGNFTEVKQIIEFFSRMFGKEFEFKESSKEKIPNHFIEGRTAEILFQNEQIGFAGEVHPRVLRNWKIKMPVVLLEIDITEILKDFD